MDPSEKTRHAARGELVESSVLEDDDRLWSPGNPLHSAAQGKMQTAPDYYEHILEGRTQKWKRSYWTTNALLAALIVAYLGLLYLFFIYGPDLGEITATALFLAGAAVLGVAALWIGRRLSDLEYGSPASIKEEHKKRGL